MKNGTIRSFAQILCIALACLRLSRSRSGLAATLVIELSMQARFGLLNLDGHHPHQWDLSSFIRRWIGRGIFELRSTSCFSGDRVWGVLSSLLDAGRIIQVRVDLMLF